MAAFKTTMVAQGLYAIVDVLGNHCYLVCGEERALLVDSCGGFGNLRQCVEGCTDLPVTVTLTHGHEDHMMGSYWFDEVRLSKQDGGEDCWELAEEHTQRIYEQLVGEGLVSRDAPFVLRDAIRPRELLVTDGDVFDLGGRTVRAVALPGHTAGSMGYLIEDCGVLLSGDAVTPVMCLFFDGSSSIEGWVEGTLARMAELPFVCFYTGHHDDAFPKDVLPSFQAAAAYALTDRGMEWEHNRLHEFRGIIHLCPSDTFDADSVDFRAIIDHWHELPPRMRKARRR